MFQSQKSRNTRTHALKEIVREREMLKSLIIFSISEISQQKEQELDIIHEQAGKIESLLAELKVEKSHFEQHLMECELQKQQQAYIRGIMVEKDKKIIPSPNDKNCQKHCMSHKLV